MSRTPSAPKFCSRLLSDKDQYFRGNLPCTTLVPK